MQFTTDVNIVKSNSHVMYDMDVLFMMDVNLLLNLFSNG